MIFSTHVDDYLKESLLMVLTYISCSVVQHAAALCFSIAASATFSLFNLPLSDVIDVDQDKYKRKYDATGAFALTYTLYSTTFLEVSYFA